MNLKKRTCNQKRVLSKIYFLDQAVEGKEKVVFAVHALLHLRQRPFIGIYASTYLSLLPPPPPPPLLPSPSSLFTTSTSTYLSKYIRWYTYNRIFIFWNIFFLSLYCTSSFFSFIYCCFTNFWFTISLCNSRKILGS